MCMQKIHLFTVSPEPLALGTVSFFCFASDWWCNIMLFVSTLSTVEHKECSSERLEFKGTCHKVN